jgi:hypothetical protein
MKIDKRDQEVLKSSDTYALCYFWKHLAWGWSSACIILIVSLSSVYAQNVSQNSSSNISKERNINTETKAAPSNISNGGAQNANRNSVSNIPATPEATSLTESKDQVVAALNEIRNILNQREKSDGWLTLLDKSLDSTLAATLAGLSIAAATFLISMTAPLAEEIEMVRNGNHIPNQVKVDRLEKSKTAIKNLMASFYVFVFLLAESLSLDHMEEPGALLGGSLIANYADIIAATGLLGVGVYLLGQGAISIKSIVIEEKKQPAKAANTQTGST